MKTTKLALLSLVVLLSVTTASAQSVDAIIKKHIKATGGKKKIKKITSIYIESSINVMGDESPTTITVLDGNGYKLVSDIMGSQMVQCYTDQGGWSINPMGGSSYPEPMPDDQYKEGKDQIYVAGPLFDYARKGNKLELLDQEMVGTVNAYKIKLITKDNIETTYYMDPSTCYIIRTVKATIMMGQEMDVTTNYSDYQKTDFGYVMPFTLDTDYGGQFSFTVNMKKIEVNKPVDPEIFNMPN